MKRNLERELEDDRRVTSHDTLDIESYYASMYDDSHQYIKIDHLIGDENRGMRPSRCELGKVSAKGAEVWRRSARIKRDA